MMLDRDKDIEESVDLGSSFEKVVKSQQIATFALIIGLTALFVAIALFGK